MSGIPLASTTISVLRRTQQFVEPYTDTVVADRTVVATGVRAHINGWGGSEITTGGEQQNITASFTCDPCDIDHRDLVRDDTTGQTYEVQWVQRRKALGFDYVRGSLVQATGLP